MNSIIILLVISMLFLDIFFSVSNEAIVVVFLAGRVVAGGGLGDSRRVSPTPVRRCPSISLRLRRLLQGPGGVQLRNLLQKGESCFCLGRSSTPEAKLEGGQAAAGQDDQCEGPGAGSWIDGLS